MERYDVINVECLPTFYFKMKNMVDETEKEICLKINDMVSILYARTREQIVSSGPQDGMIYRGRVKEITKIPCRSINDNIYQITLDCSDKFGSKIELFNSNRILDINEFDYVYEKDDPSLLESNISLICNNIDDHEKIVDHNIPHKYVRI